jgi:hypothetical protein
MPKPGRHALAADVSIKADYGDGYFRECRSPYLDAVCIASDRTRDQARGSSKFFLGTDIDDNGRPLRADVKSEVLWCY